MLVTGCSSVGTDAPDSEDGFLETSAESYEVRANPREGVRYAFDVPYTIHNPTVDTLFLLGCNRPSPPRLEKWEGGRWKLALEGVAVPLCLSPPWPVAPGRTRRDTLQVFTSTSENSAPTLVTELEGRYRLKETIYSEAARDGSDSDPIPEEQHVSNTFRLRKVE